MHSHLGSKEELTGRVPMLTELIRGRHAWVKDDLVTEDWFVTLSEPCLSELQGVVQHLRRKPLPLLLLNPDDFRLDECRETMNRVRQILDEGVRFAVVDRLPLDRISKDEAKALFWLLSTLVARPVAQKLDGTMIYDVVDTGLKADAGTAIRPDKTNTEIVFHNDNAYNQAPPEYTSLLCLRTAKKGPLSRIMSVNMLHNELLRRHPEVLPRLYMPFWFDRNTEHHPDEDRLLSAPIFTFDGELIARLALHQLRNGYKLKGEEMDAAAIAAIDALEDVFMSPDLWLEFFFGRGQLQFLNNFATVHSRTAFEDHEEPEKKRHVVRLWSRDEGDRAYPG